MKNTSYKKRIFAAPALLALMLAVASLGSCARLGDSIGELEGTLEATDGENTNDDGSVSLETVTPVEIPEADFDVEVRESEYDTTEAYTKIILNDKSTLIEGDGATYSDGKLTITSQGLYLLSGKLNDGNITVDTTDEEKVKLILCGVGVNCSAGPAITVLNAPKKVILYSAEDSVNVFSDGADYIVPDEEQTEDGIYPNACIYSTADLKFDGDGEIYIISNCGKGVNTKDDLEICGGKIYVSATDDGLRGNDSFEMSGGYLSVSAGADGIKSANAETEGKGYILISGGEIYVTCALDGLQAEKELTVSGGTLSIKCADGAGEMLDNTTNGGMGGGPGGMGGKPGGMGGGPGGMEEGNSSKPEESCKALKCGTILTVSGGSITADTPDDAIHSNDILTVTGGTLSLKAGDDGLHADNVLTIDNATVDITQSYEGVEAVKITVNSGSVKVVSSDDGFNACGGTSMMGGGRPGSFGGSSSSSSTSGETPTLTFNGGYVIVNAAGDGIDSNGHIVMTGGTVIVYGPTSNGNGAIDFGDGNYNMTISGGTLLAVGSSGMAETALGNGQGVIAFSLGTAPAETILSIADENSNEIFTFASPKTYQTVVFSSPDIVKGNTYKVYYNGTHTGTLTDGIYVGGTYSDGEELGSLEAD